MIFIPYELRPENIQILDYQHSVSESLCEPIHHSKALDKLFLVIKSALLDSLIQSKYGQKTVGAFSASDTVHTIIHDVCNVSYMFFLTLFCVFFFFSRPQSSDGFDPTRPALLARAERCSEVSNTHHDATSFISLLSLSCWATEINHGCAALAVLLLFWILPARCIILLPAS